MMLGSILHVGLTVRDLRRSVAFYRDVLGLRETGRLTMEGEAAALLFGRPGCGARIAYLKGGSLSGPPVELIELTGTEIERQEASLFRTSISELCFETAALDAEYRRLKALGVEFLSEPQDFDFPGFGRSRAVYFRDPDGVILELLEALD